MKFERSTTSLVCGILSLTVGVAGVLGWRSNNAAILQGTHGFMPLKYNAALELIITGLALALTNLRRRQAAIALSATALFFAALHLAEHLLRLDLGIDQMFMKDYINAAAMHPGRMPIDVSFNFLFTTAALLAINQRLFNEWKFLVAAVLGGTVIAGGLIMLLGYLIGLVHFIEALPRYQMSILASIGVSLLGIGLLAFSWRNEQTTRILGRPWWAPYIAGSIVFAAAINLAQITDQKHEHDIRASMKFILQALHDKILQRLRNYFDVVLYVSHSGNAFLGPNKEHWLSEAGFHIRHCTGIQAFAWIDPMFIAQEVVPRKGHEDILKADLAAHRLWSPVLRRAIQTKEEVFAISEDNASIGVLAPTFEQNRLIGFTLGFINFKNSLDDLLKSERLYNVKLALYIGNKEVYTRGGAPNMDAEKAFGEELNMSLDDDLPWRLKIWPTAALMSQLGSAYAAPAIRIAGSFLALLCMLMIRHLQKAALFNQALGKAAGERQKIEKEFRDSEEKYRRLFAAENNAIMLADAETELIIDVNEAASSLYQYSKNEFQQLRARDLAAEPKEAEAALELVKLGQPHRARLSYHRKKDGTVFPAEIAAGSFLLKGKGVLFCVVQDITERRKTEKELQDSKEKLQQLAIYLQTAQENERARIAREIHDELGQSLTVMKMNASWIGGNLLPSQAQIRQKIHSICVLSDDTIDAMRRIATGLRPKVLDDLGIVAAIEWHIYDYQKRTDIKCIPDLVSADIPMKSERALSLFRVYQEAMTNVVRHAQASKVHVRLRQTGDYATLEVEDDGRGITREQLSAANSLGILGMEERINSWGGELHISGQAGKGTLVFVKIPL